MPSAAAGTTSSLRHPIRREDQSAMTRCHGAYYDGVLQVICAGSPQVVRIAGEIDESSYPGLVSTLDDLVDREGDVHINLAGLACCDVAGLRAILQLAGTGGGGESHRGRYLFLDDIPHHLAMLLQILGWNSIPGLIMNEPQAHATPFRHDARFPSTWPARSRSASYGWPAGA